MSKFWDDFHKYKIIYWIIGSISLIILILNISWFGRILGIESILQLEVYLYVKPVIILFSIITFIISLFQIKRIKRIKGLQFINTLLNFFRPFSKDCNYEWQKPLVVILFLIIIPGFIFTFFYYFQLFTSGDTFKGYNFFDQLSYVLAYVGLLLTVRVYFEVKEGHTESLEDFIRTLTEILDLSDDEDEIVIYAPTLFLNEAHIINKTATYKNIAYRNKLKNKKRLKLHVLDTDESLDKFHENIKKKELENDDTNYGKHVSSFKESKCKLNLFHKWSLNFELEEKANHVHKRTEYYHGFISFMKSIPKESIIGDYKLIEPKSITIDDIEEGKISKARGSFAVANFDKGLYYFGSFEASDEAKPYFRGTLFTNKNIDKVEFRNLIALLTE